MEVRDLNTGGFRALQVGNEWREWGGQYGQEKGREEGYGRVGEWRREGVGLWSYGVI